MSELSTAEGVDGWVDDGVAHQQHHMQLEQRSVTLAVRVHGAHHDDDEVEGKWRPTHHECPKQDGESQGSSHAASPPPLTPTLPPATGGQSSDLPGVDARQHEHVDVEEADNHQGDDEEDNKADHDELGVEEPHHEHGRHPTCCPDDTQDGPCAPHCHDVVVSKSTEDGDVTGSENKSFYNLLNLSFLSTE